MDRQQLRFARSHEWVHVEGSQATVGISDFAVKELTDLVFIQLPEVGTGVKQGEPFGEVESVKAVSDLYAPCSGKIVAVNAQLVDDLAPLSDDPYGNGWIVKMTIANPSELDSLMDYDAYQKFCESEAH